MKKILLYSLLFLSYSIQSQTYSLTFDSTFGTNGVVANDYLTFYPRQGLLINGSYFFVSYNGIGKFQYNGATDLSFGSYGFRLFNSGNETYTISNFKYINSSIYVYGKVTTNSIDDIFICKMDENGSFDPGFGINGMKKIDFGQNETLENFTVDANGNFYCVGTRSDSTTSRLIHFKLNTDGSINTAFDTNGYKEFLLNLSTTGGGIIPSGNNFILIGTSTNYINSVRYQDLLLTKVDTNGNVISSFGTNGSMTKELYGGMSIVLKDVQLVSNNLYVSYYYAWSFTTQGRKLIKLDLNTNQTVFNKESFYDFDYQIDNNNDLYIVGSERCNSQPCMRNFHVSKLLANGSADSQFGTNGTYSYDFPNILYSDDNSTVVVKDDTGRILIAGFVIRTYINQNNVNASGQGLSMIRLVEGTLGVDSPDLKKPHIYPNPFSDFITIESANPIKSFELFDVNGRILDKPAIQLNETNMHINIPNLNRGLYFIKLTLDDGKTFTEKIIKQ